ncbi:DUF1302 domain-containing protein [Zavarzinia compransoris]|uniref:DUF1302 domain-containing protein n=1 Tax=Zavarzinia marina TaxID=2911065 RepID=UPI001F249CD7|nr:DUF1302 family protein [Zavarzinia marina]MCF4165280.1 DUF1302 domain-containing protein [Zavarzinia marina]
MHASRHPGRPARRIFLTATAVCALTAAAGAAAAYEFDVGDEITVSIIGSLSTGAQIRMADRDPRNYGYYYGGGLISSGNDDGNLNFDKYDLISQITTAKAELSVEWRNFLVYVRGAAFYDWVADNNDLADFDPAHRVYNSGRYHDGAADKANWDAYLLDYYVRGDFTLFDNYLGITVGNQILNWGEALFTINGISVINPIDAGKIRVPGAELKDALIPVPMVSVNYEIASGLSVEAFYQLDFEPFKLDACGSFFSFTDNFCDGVKVSSSFTDPYDTRSYTSGSGLNPNDYDDPNSVLLAANAPITTLDDPDTDDWGVSLRYFSPELNNTEFQLYYVRYNSRLPSLYAESPAQFAPGTGETNLAALPAPLLQGLLDQLGVDALNQLTTALSNVLGGPITDIAGALTNPLSNVLIDPAFGTAPRSTVLKNLEGGGLYQYYPSDLEMIGFAFNTTYDPLAVAINAEVSWKHNVPIWISEPAFLAAVYNSAGGVPIDQATKAETELCVQPVCVQNPGIAPILETPFSGHDDQYVPGGRVFLDEPHDVWQAAIRFMQIRGGSDWVTKLLGANQLFALVEFGALHVDLDNGTQYAAYGQNGFTGFRTRPLNLGPVTVQDPIYATNLGPYFPSTWKNPSKWSGGVQGLVFWDYPNVMDGVTMTPSVGFSHGLFGVTPAPTPGFVKSVTSLNFAVKFDYLEHWSLSVNYFKSFGGGGGGGGSRNPYIDRDFVGFNLTYSL